MDVETTDGLHGREFETAQLQSALSEGAAVLTGMPGIGKTASIKSLCPPKRYVTMNASMDAQSLVAKWLEIDDALWICRLNSKCYPNHTRLP